jgi:hypothetical protein
VNKVSAHKAHMDSAYIEAEQTLYIYNTTFDRDALYMLEAANLHIKGFLGRCASNTKRTTVKPWVGVARLQEVFVLYFDNPCMLHS